MNATPGLTNGTTELLLKREALFHRLTDPEAIPRFFDSVAENVSWTLHGKHPLAGEYTSKQAFLDQVIHRLGPMMRNGLRFQINRLHIGDPVTVAEMESTSIGHDGAPYDQVYAWICTFDERDTIINVHAYVDSVAVIEFLRRNEG
ncbi:nuclear transport factor 2 family protein [Streptomyces iconiensis]|uniref:SnoaL-like domain-containing protein n=1 Tax=Streptomyces iconiensis TaxID=1384038 RepID=A0ABT6ZYR9_9ACTN|nr:hypothetical protein [Streptomyces iconiensis]MDJ1134223.1 hypothetical protein [Streptomyces iconiensis]